MDRWCIRVSLEVRKLPGGRGKESHARIQLYESSCLEISRSTRRRRFIREAPWMAERRARAAAAPRPARPRPPAKRGLLNRSLSGRKEEGGGGFDIVRCGVGTLLSWKFLG
jgi:hypothetical protein